MFLIAASWLALLVAIATDSASQASGPEQKTRALVAADNEFGFNLLEQVQRQGANKNIFISPLSIATALGMTYNGAAGETGRAMGETLKLASMSLAEVNQGNASLLAGLKGADPKVELAIANSLWARQGVEFKPEFLARNRQFYGATVATLDFRSPTAVNTINSWVKANTKGKIPQIIGEINAQTVMLLLNAVYFKGQWQAKFDKAKTKDEPFHLLAGRQKPVPMMSQSGAYPYYRGERFQAISLLYGQGGTSVYLFLPDQEVPLNDFLKGLSYESWEQWLRQFNRAPGDLKLPRFKLAYERDLNAPLAALGMGVALEARSADFTGMRAARDLFIEQVKHKAVVEVNEEGTEAAAVTSVGVATTSVRPQPERFTFIADRPFWMAIRDGRSGAILFMGAVVEPE